MTKKSRRVAKARRVLLSLSLVLVVAFAAVGGTVAWLTDKGNTITNTFTIGKVDIELDETVDSTERTAEFKMMPGTSYLKDPVVTVVAGSEKCYLFVKFEEINNPSTYLAYTSNLNDTTVWTKLTGVTGVDNVWFKVVETDDENQDFQLLAGNDALTVIDITKTAPNNTTTGGKGYVTVKDTVGTTTVPMPTASAQPQLKYTAYAIQYDNFATEQLAWAEVAKLN